MIDTSKKFLVAGAGKSGIGSVNLLLKNRCRCQSV